MPIDSGSELIKLASRHLSVNDESGRTVLAIGLKATLFLEHGCDGAIRAAVASCCNKYEALQGRHLRWALSPDTGVMEPFGAGKGRMLEDWLPSLPDGSEYYILLHGAADERGASAFYFEALGIPWALSYVRISIPVPATVDECIAFHDFLIDVCRSLCPVSGYAGISVIESPDSMISVDYEPVVYQWAQRFPGLEADYPSSHVTWLCKGREGSRPGIKGVNWITILSTSWVEEMGGMPELSTKVPALDPRLSVSPYECGVLIRAGDSPQLGDAERDSWPELYVKLSKYLRPIRISQHRPFHHDNGGIRFDRQRSEAWLRRFDER